MRRCYDGRFQLLVNRRDERLDARKAKGDRERVPRLLQCSLIGAGIKESTARATTLSPLHRSRKVRYERVNRKCLVARAHYTT